MLLVLLLAFGAAQAAGVPKVVLDACDSVVRIEVETEEYYVIGSGFLVQRDTWRTIIATNAHVVEDKGILSVWYDGEQLRSVRILAADEACDLALLEVTDIIKVTALPIHTGGGARHGGLRDLLSRRSGRHRHGRGARKPGCYRHRRGHQLPARLTQVLDASPNKPKELRMRFVSVRTPSTLPGTSTQVSGASPALFCTSSDA